MLHNKKRVFINLKAMKTEKLSHTACVVNNYTYYRLAEFYVSFKEGERQLEIPIQKAILSL